MEALLRFCAGKMPSLLVRGNLGCGGNPYPCTETYKS